jgi:hypothetical protein
MPTAEAAQRWEQDTIGPEKWPNQTCVSKELEEEIKQAKKLLDLGDDWDGQGSACYTRETFNRAIGFLTAHAERLCTRFNQQLPVPRIGAGPHGSIDIHWKSPWELLVNIPADPNELASFYGDNYGKQAIKGSFDPKTFNLGIVAWLMH